MPMHHYRGNIHMHTLHSDGEGTVEEVIAAARRSGLHFIILTDHNTLLDQRGEGWQDGVLVLIDSEVHDRKLQPQRNHCLTLGLRTDVTPHAGDPQGLIDAVRRQGGLAFFAHPIDKPSPLLPETYPWTNWDVEGYTGIELWNFMSEFRPYATSKARALVVGYFPWLFTTAPYPEMLAKWDELLQQQPTPALGGSDAHAKVYTIFGPLRRRFLPYDYCFRAVNTHILTPEPFTGDYEHDRGLVYGALAHGRAWIAYDMLAASEGFRFSARWRGRASEMGDSLPADGGVTFEVALPAPGRIRLLRAGAGVVAETQGAHLEFQAGQAGAYRVEVWKRRWFKQRGWIFSNPIYLI